MRLLTKEELDDLRIEKQNDPFHKDDPDWDPILFFVPGTTSLVIEDGEGVLAYLNIANEARIRIQHAHDVSKERMREGYRINLPLVEAELRARNVKGIVFNSVSKGLVRFLRKAGFGHLPNEYRKTL
jgi:hypothetical protein